MGFTSLLSRIQVPVVVPVVPVVVPVTRGNCSVISFGI